MHRNTALILSVMLSSLFQLSASAASRNRVLTKVDDTQRVYLTGHVHPKAKSQYDQGALNPSTELTHLTMNFKLSAAQQADLEQLLSDQQNPASTNYHHWLTPEEYGARFGLSDDDLAKTISWLQGQGFTVTGTARARNFVTFDAVAATAQKAFRTEMHQYLVNGETHFANATEPSIPAALQPVIHGIGGLNDFKLKPRLTLRDMQPRDTTASGHHYVAPDDFATIYDMKPLYAAGFDGTGQKLVIVGQTTIALSDLQAFRTAYNLPGQDPQLVQVPNTRSPGRNSGDLGEADLDLEWSGAVARNATIIYVYSPDVVQSMQYAIDQNLAPVVSMSYGSCEPSNLASDAASFRSMAQQANLQGITWFNASGDSGGADCVGQTTSNTGASVDIPASVPEVTGVGGTAFVEGTGTYWNATNDTNQASALSYIPETAWNDSAIDGSPSASGGGASIFYSKPAWQSGPGVPSDGARDVPDISLAASADHDGYDSISGGKTYSVGGTSAPTPIFAGIAAVLNQYLVQNGFQTAPGLGNINPKLYSLAQSAPGAFHDITTGDNLVTPPCPRRGCTTQPTPVGFTAGPGYDQVTGLGSVDIYNLFLAWTGVSSNRLTPQISVSASSSSISSGDTTLLTATISSSNGVTPTGNVLFQLGTTTLGSAALTGSAGTATATLSVSGSQLAAGANNITAQYTSDNSTFGNAAGTVTVTVSQSSVGLSITGIADGASFHHSYAPGEVLSIFGSNLAGNTQTASTIPLPNSINGVQATISGIAAPLYMVSAGQLNVQIPYETPLNTDVTLVVQSSGQTASYSFTVNPVAPAIFTDNTGAPVPAKSGKVGDIITLYMTGAGAVTPTIATGATPAAGTPVTNLPRPIEGVSVTVGGVIAPIQFVGIPSGLVGTVQVNYMVPSGVTPGVQPVVVTVGTSSSPQANLTVTQ